MFKKNIEMDPLNFMGIFVFHDSTLHCKGSLGVMILK